MQRFVRLLPRAERDAQSIFEWIRARSVEGARRWWTTFEAAQATLAKNPEAFSRAPESHLLGRDIRQKLSKTPRGRTYRLTYTIAEDEVWILRIRGPGQPPLEADEMLPRS
jgi:plasmid stabilization system protein ParE